LVVLTFDHTKFILPHGVTTFLHRERAHITIPKCKRKILL